VYCRLCAQRRSARRTQCSLTGRFASLSNIRAVEVRSCSSLRQSSAARLSVPRFAITLARFRVAAPLTVAVQAALHVRFAVFRTEPVYSRRPHRNRCAPWMPMTPANFERTSATISPKPDASAAVGIAEAKDVGAGAVKRL